MVRPLKAGLSYFPLDTDIDQDDKIALIEAQHGIIGFGIIIKLFKKIYSNSGYYYEWNEQTQLLFSRQVGVDFKKVIEVIDDALKWGLFENKLFKKYKILTSKRIQRTYLEATTRRREINLIQEYLLNGVNVNIKADNVNIYAINNDKSTQRKEERGKGKRKRKEENKIKYLDSVFLTEEEHQKLIEKLGEDKTEDMIERLDLYIGSKGTKYKSHYKTILNWIKMDKKQKENWRTT